MAEDTTAPDPGETTTPAPDDAPAENFFGSTPETWRQDLTSYAGFEGDDATAFSNVLERVPDVKTFAQNYKNLQDKVRSGEMQFLPENPSDEQLAAYREYNGVPADPKSYDLGEIKLQDEGDGSLFSSVFEAAHSGNVSNDAMKGIAQAFTEAQAKQAERYEQQDSVDSQQAMTELKERWGGDYQTNVNMVDSLLSGMPAEVKDKFTGGRLADGRAILNDPAVSIFLADLARKVNPGSAVVPGSNNPLQTISDEISKIEETLRSDPDRYWKDNGMQQRYEQLLDAREKMK